MLSRDRVVRLRRGDFVVGSPVGLNATRRTGFTLLELLVVVVLAGALLAALVPAVLGRLRVGEQAAIMADFSAIRSAMLAFKQDVGVYPADLRELAVAPTAASRDICNRPLSSSATGWNGPYLSREIPATGLPSGSGLIRIAVRRSPAGSSPSGTAFVDVDGVEGQIASEIERAVDGNGDLTGGTVRWVAATRVLSFAIPVSRC
jgi:prepilin-type N-terminal cleavage/methylation domain-containing protein